MKKMPNTVDNIKQKILALKGKEVKLDVNRDRRKVSSYRAVIEDVYNSVCKNSMSLITCIFG